MNDKILDEIFKFSRNQKEILYDNFDEVCRIIGIKTAQNSDATEDSVADNFSIEDSVTEDISDFSEAEEVQKNPLKIEAENYVNTLEEILNDQDPFIRVLNKLNKSERQLMSLSKDTLEYQKQKTLTEGYRRESSSILLSYIKEEDFEFYEEIEENIGKEGTPQFDSYIKNLVELFYNKRFKIQNQELQVVQTQYSDYIQLLSYQVNREDLVKLNNLKNDLKGSRSLNKEYLNLLFSTIEDISFQNNKLGNEPSNSDSYLKIKNILEDKNLENKEELFEQLLKILGKDDVQEEEVEKPDQYIQERIEELQFTPTGEPFFSAKDNKWFQVYGHIWTIPIKTKRDENGDIVPDINEEWSDEYEKKQSVYPLIDLEPIQYLHNYFISKKNMESGIVKSEEETISDIRNILSNTKAFSQKTFDEQQSKLLNEIWKSYSEKYPEEKMFKKDFQTINKDSNEYKKFIMMIKAEDVESILSSEQDEETGELKSVSKFFENLKFIKGVIRDLPGYAARATIASSVYITPENYNYIIKFCEQYYGSDLEFLNTESKKSIGEIVKSYQSGEDFGNFEEQIKYIYDNIVPKIKENTKSKEDEEVYEILDQLFSSEKIIYFKNIKDRSVDFSEQQELSHHSTYSYHGKSNFCRHCGRFRGRILASDNINYGGPSDLHTINGKPYFVRPSEDKDIVISPSDTIHISEDTLNKYFNYNQQEEKYFQKKCDFQRNSNGEIFASCDITNNILFEKYARTPSMNEMFVRDVLVTLDGEPLMLTTNDKDEKGNYISKPIQLNEEENELVQNFSSILLDDYLEKIRENLIKFGMSDSQGNPVVRVLKPIQDLPKIKDIKKDLMVDYSKQDSRTESVTIDRSTLREALKEYLEVTSSRISDSILGSGKSTARGSGKQANEYSVRVQRSARILFHALEAYNYFKYTQESEENLNEEQQMSARERARFLAGSDLVQLFACGATATNKTMLSDVGLRRGGEDPAVPLRKRELDLKAKDRYGNPILDDAEKELTIKEYLKTLKKLQFLDADLPSEDSVSMGFIYGSLGSGTGYDTRMSGISSFLDESLKKSQAINIYMKIKDIVSNPNLTIEQREEKISEAWSGIRFGYVLDEEGNKISTNNPSIYRKVKVPSYAVKPSEFYTDKDGHTQRNPDYEQHLSNWIRQHLLFGSVKLSDEEMAFYAMEPSKAAEVFITMMDDLFSTFDYDMPNKNASLGTDTDVEVFLQKKNDLSKTFYGFTDEEYLESYSDERIESYSEFIKNNVDLMPMPQKGDCVRIKSEGNSVFDLYAILELKRYDREKGEAEYLALPGKAYNHERYGEDEDQNEYDKEEKYLIKVFFDSLENPVALKIPVTEGAVDRKKYHVTAGEGAFYLKDNAIAVLTGRFKDKYHFMGSDYDREKFVKAAIARWLDRTPSVTPGNLSKNKTQTRQSLLGEDIYKEVLDEKEELYYFEKYYCFSKFKQSLSSIKRDGNVRSEDIAEYALNKIANELKSSYISEYGAENLKTDEENIFLLKHRIFKEIIQISIIERKSFKEIEEELGISISEFFGGIDGYKIEDEIVQGVRCDYIPSFFPKIKSAQEELKHFSKAGLASIVFDSGSADELSSNKIFGHITGYDENEEPISKQERTVLTHKQFTSFTEKLMKLSFINKEVSLRIYDYVNNLSKNGAYTVAFTPKINQLLGILGLNMIQSKINESPERPATISRALVLYSNAIRGTFPNREAGFPLGMTNFSYNDESDLGSANEFKWHMSPIHAMLQAIPEWGMGGVSFVEGLNSVVQGAKPESYSGISEDIQSIRRKVKQNKNKNKNKNANNKNWYKVSENKDNVFSGKFTHVVVTSGGDMMNCLKNSQIRSRNGSRVLPYIKVFPYEKFGSIKRILEFKKRTGYKAIVLTDVEYSFLNEVGLIPNG